MTIIIENVHLCREGQKFPWDDWDQIMSVVDTVEVEISVHGSQPIVRHRMTIPEHGDAPEYSSRGLSVKQAQTSKNWNVRWDINKALSGAYRMGTQTIDIFLSEDTEAIQSFSIYVLPTDIFDLDTTLLMLKSIERFVQRSPLWSADSLESQAYVEQASSEYVLPLRRLEQIKKEVRWCQSLRRDPLFHRQGVPVFELDILPRWYQHTIRWLKDQLHALEVEIAYKKQRLIDNPPRRPADNRKDVLKERQATQITVLGILRKVRQLKLEQAPIKEIVMTPLMQRDYRLRGLLKSLNKRNGLLPVKKGQQLSQQPMQSINRIFELWGAVWLVQQLQGQGFELLHTDVQGHTDIVATWHLQRNQVEVWIDFEPRVVNCSQIPLVGKEHRIYADQEYKVRQEAKTTEADFYGASNNVSPDYLIRMRNHDTGQALLMVGDASFVSRHTLENRTGHSLKLSVLQRYRKNIFWRLNDTQFVSIPWNGAFCLYPHSDANTEMLEQQFDQKNVWTIFASPLTSNDAFQQLLSNSLRRLAVR